jgi:hypothetical protein
MNIEEGDSEDVLFALDLGMLMYAGILLNSY